MIYSSKKIFSILIITISIIFSSMFVGCTEDPEKAQMICTSYTLEKAEIIDNRQGYNKISVTIEDEERLQLIKDTFSGISGTEMEDHLQDYFPNQYYAPNFPDTLFKFNITALNKKGERFKMTIYGGQKIPVYTGGYEGGTPEYYNYDYNYICKKDNETGHYENKQLGPNVEFYKQFFN